MRALIIILAATFAIVVLWVALANAGQQVSLSLGVGEPRTASLAEVIVFAVLSGVLFIGMLAVVEGLTLRVENLKLQRRLHRLEEEVFDLRNLALRDSGMMTAAQGSRPMVPGSPSPDGA